MKEPPDLCQATGDVTTRPERGPDQAESSVTTSPLASSRARSRAVLPSPVRAPVGAAPQQESHEIGVAVMRGEVERRVAALRAASIHGTPAVDEESNDVAPTPRSRRIDRQSASWFRETASMSAPASSTRSAA